MRGSPMPSWWLARDSPRRTAMFSWVIQLSTGEGLATDFATQIFGTGWQTKGWRGRPTEKALIDQAYRASTGMAWDQGDAFL